MLLDLAPSFPCTRLDPPLAAGATTTASCIVLPVIAVSTSAGNAAGISDAGATLCPDCWATWARCLQPARAGPSHAPPSCQRSSPTWCWFAPNLRLKHVRRWALALIRRRNGTSVPLLQAELSREEPAAEFSLVARASPGREGLVCRRASPTGRGLPPPAACVRTKRRVSAAAAFGYSSHGLRPSAPFPPLVGTLFFGGGSPLLAQTPLLGLRTLIWAFSAPGPHILSHGLLCRTLCPSGSALPNNLVKTLSGTLRGGGR